MPEWKGISWEFPDSIPPAPARPRPSQPSRPLPSESPVSGRRAAFGGHRAFPPRHRVLSGPTSDSGDRSA